MVVVVKYKKPQKLYFLHKNEYLDVKVAGIGLVTQS